MKWLVIIFIVVLSYLQYRLWVGEGSVASLVELQAKIDQQSAENERLKARNRLLAAEVEALKNTDDAIEERARTDLGLIKEGETFFMVVEPTASK